MCHTNFLRIYTQLPLSPRKKIKHQQIRPSQMQVPLITNRRATQKKKNYKKQMRLSFFFPHALSHLCPQLTRKGVPFFFSEICVCFLLQRSSGLSRHRLFINNTRGVGDERGRKWGNRLQWGTMLVREYMYTFIHGQPAFTEVTLIVNRRLSSLPPHCRGTRVTPK